MSGAKTSNGAAALDLGKVQPLKGDRNKAPAPSRPQDIPNGHSEQAVNSHHPEKFDSSEENNNPASSHLGYPPMYPQLYTPIYQQNLISEPTSPGSNNAGGAYDFSGYVHHTGYASAPYGPGMNLNGSYHQVGVGAPMSPYGQTPQSPMDPVNSPALPPNYFGGNPYSNLNVPDLSYVSDQSNWQQHMVVNQRQFPGVQPRRRRPEDQNGVDSYGIRDFIGSNPFGQQPWYPQNDMYGGSGFYNMYAGGQDMSIYEAYPYSHPCSPGPPIQASGHSKGPDGANLFIFHIPNNFSNKELFDLFEPYGNLLSVRIMVEAGTGRSRGFGFVSYDTPESAAKAIKALNGYAVKNKRLKVQHKQITPSKSPTPQDSSLQESRSGDTSGSVDDESAKRHTEEEESQETETTDSEPVSKSALDTMSTIKGALPDVRAA